MTPTAEQREKAREPTEQHIKRAQQLEMNRVRVLRDCSCNSLNEPKHSLCDGHYCHDNALRIAQALAAESAAAEERIARLRAMILEGIETIEFASMRAPGSAVWVRRARAALEETP